VLRTRLAFLLGAVAAVGLVGTGCAEQSAAIRVGDDTVSEKDFLDEVQALGESETALQLMVGAARTDVVGELGDDSYTQPFVGYMIQQRVSLILQGQLAEQEGIELTEAERDEVRDLIEGEFENAGAQLSDLPDGYVDQLIDDIAISQALTNEMPPDELQTAFLELADRADVDLSSRFGEWDNDAFVASLQGQGQGQPISAVTPPAAPQAGGGAGAGAGAGSDAGGQGGTDPGSPAG
jgi:hypothetical protein